MSLAPVVSVKSILDFSCFAGGSSITNAVKSSKVYKLLFNFYLRDPFFSGHAPINTCNSARVCARPALVLSILRVCGVAQIFNSIVLAIVVNVVYLINRPRPGSNCPDYAMRKIPVVKYSTPKVSVTADGGKSFFPAKSSIPSAANGFLWVIPIDKHFWRSCFPKQFATAFFIPQKLAQKARGQYFFFSHIEAFTFGVTGPNCVSALVWSKNQEGAS